MSLINRANRLGGFTTDVKHWEYEWSTTAKQNENGTDEKVKYKFKQWVRKDHPLKTFEEDDTDVLNLSEFDRTKIAKKNVRAQEKTGPNSLSINDIRGAVGGSDIPGFSGSDAKKEAEVKHAVVENTTATETPAPVEPTKADETPAQETPAGETPAGETPAGETPAEIKDQEGDINME
ncbi:unnamed protein product [Kluyveromyces dobzhanskii CBS 2104]|uniref:WGS project CCBQ000000000 data, contig 00107 n=1 Tax=Kluyveromyces dobzhanskii CBS 2104 TaxID=1427455 RepID=A0A0A8L171_9SACH|nr:unnamed protein product [Kluyveromyces dobzhanskii CBS 2104]